MKISVKAPLPDNPRNIMRRMGYAEHVGYESGQQSFTKRLGGLDYPRMHVYVNDRGTEIEFNLHLDQKKASYSGSHAHSGEYDGPLVEIEAEKIKSFIFQLRP